MNNNIIEEKRNTLNLSIRKMLITIDFIDGKKRVYEDYVAYTLNEIAFLDQQIKLIDEANERLLGIFKD